MYHLVFTRGKHWAWMRRPQICHESPRDLRWKLRRTLMKLIQAATSVWTAHLWSETCFTWSFNIFQPVFSKRYWRYCLANSSPWPTHRPCAWPLLAVLPLQLEFAVRVGQVVAGPVVLTVALHRFAGWSERIPRAFLGEGKSKSNG